MEAIKTILQRSYPIISKIPSFYFPYRFSGGRIYLDITESPMMLDRALGRYEVSKHKAIAAFLKEKSTFIDVGANKGDFSLLAAKIVGHEGTIFSIEPEPSNCEWIRKSIALNRYPNIQLHQMALSDHDGLAQLYLGENSGFHTLISGLRKRDRGSIPVPVRTLDHLLEEVGFNQPVHMVKIDVEGAEMQVLKGATGTLSHNDDLTILMDIHPHLGVKSEEVCAYLTDKGFSVFHERPPFSTPVTDTSKLTSIVARKISAE